LNISAAVTPAATVTSAVRPLQGGRQHPLEGQQGSFEQGGRQQGLRPGGGQGGGLQHGVGQRGGGHGGGGQPPQQLDLRFGLHLGCSGMLTRSEQQHGHGSGQQQGGRGGQPGGGGGQQGGGPQYTFLQPQQSGAGKRYPHNLDIISPQLLVIDAGCFASSHGQPQGGGGGGQQTSRPLLVFFGVGSQHGGGHSSLHLRGFF